MKAPESPAGEGQVAAAGVPGGAFRRAALSWRAASFWLRSWLLRSGPPLALGGPAGAPVLALPDVDVAVLLFVGRGEDVGAVVAADEVEVGHRRRPRRRLQAGQAGRADRPGGQAGVAVGVVRRVDAQIV